MSTIFLVLGPAPIFPAGHPLRSECQTLLTWGDIRTKRQAADYFMRDTLRAGDTVICLGDRVREALRLPRVLMHPIARHGATFRCLPAVSTKFYDDPTIIEIIRELMKCLTEQQRTATSA